MWFTFAEALPGLSALYGSPGVSAAGEERSDPESPMPEPGPPGKERLRLPLNDPSLDPAASFKALSFSTLVGSFSHNCMRMKGSRPLMLSMCQGLGLDNNSLTEPWERPKTCSPKC